MHSKPAFFLLVAVGIASASCGGSSSEDLGTLEQTWSIAGSTEPDACAVAGATQMRVVVLDPELVVEATQIAPCTDFRTAVDLADDVYGASVTFLDAAGIAVSKTRTFAKLTVRQDQTTPVHFDFPFDAFFLR